jgi:hypothetical protein
VTAGKGYCAHVPHPRDGRTFGNRFVGTSQNPSNIIVFPKVQRSEFDFRSAALKLISLNESSRSKIAATG